MKHLIVLFRTRNILITHTLDLRRRTCLKRFVGIRSPAFDLQRIQAQLQIQRFININATTFTRGLTFRSLQLRFKRLFLEFSAAAFFYPNICAGEVS